MTVGDFSPDTVKKAEQLLASKAVKRDDEHPHTIYWVTGSNGDTYRVQSDFDPAKRTLSWITCTCPHGLHTGGGAAKCYHAAAVLIWLRDESGAKP